MIRILRAVGVIREWATRLQGTLHPQRSDRELEDEFLRRDAHSFSALAEYSSVAFNATDGSLATLIGGARVTADFFQIFEVPSEIGRVIGAADVRDRARNAVISHQLWQSAFGGEIAVLQRTLMLNGQPYSIIGVMPPSFNYPQSSDLGPDAVARTTDVWVPHALTADQLAERDLSNNSGAVGRLRPGASIERAQAETGALISQLDRLHSPEWRGWFAVVKPFAESSLRTARRPMLLLLGAVFLVLLIACSNTANLLPPSEPCRIVELLRRRGLPQRTQSGCEYPLGDRRFFQAMGTPLLDGRLLSDTDVDGRQSIVVVNQAFVKAFMAGPTPLGRHFRIRNFANDARSPWGTVVGVVADVRHSNVEEAAPPQVYASLFQGNGFDNFYLAVRASNDPRNLTLSIRKKVHDLDPVLAVADVQSMGDRVSAAVALRRFQTTVLTLFGMMSLALTAVGIGGLMAYSVRQRRAEIGVRLALGARARDISWLILGEGLRVTLLGVLFGVAGALSLSRVLRAILFGVAPTDPVVLAAAFLLLMAVTSIAAYIPLRRALRVDPLISLRGQ